MRAEGFNSGQCTPHGILPHSDKQYRQLCRLIALEAEMIYFHIVNLNHQLI